MCEHSGMGFAGWCFESLRVLRVLRGSRFGVLLMNDQLPADDNQIIADRRAKLAALRAQGQAFPNDFRRDALAADVHARHGAKSNEELEQLHAMVTVAGRMM